MGRELPGWVVDNAESVRREAEPYIDMTPEERSRILSQVCRTAMSILEHRTDRQVVFDWVDPVPESTLKALVRLRAEEKARRR